MITPALPDWGFSFFEAKSTEIKKALLHRRAERKQPPTVIHVSLTPDNNGDISVDAAADIIHVPKGKENIEFFQAAHGNGEIYASRSHTLVQEVESYNVAQFKAAYIRLLRGTSSSTISTIYQHFKSLEEV